MKKPDSAVDTQRAWLKERIGQYITVRGTWTGDFLGKLTSVDFTQCWLEVAKRFSGDPPVGHSIRIPFGRFVKFSEPTDSERRIEISDVAPDITI